MIQNLNSLSNALRRFAMDAAPWEESKHHRADNGRFTSGSGRGKTGGDTNADAKKKRGEENESGKEEMSLDEAERHVKAAFKDAECDIKSMKLEGHALSTEVAATGEELCGKVNQYLKKHGLKAKIESGTMFKIAEDAGEELGADSDDVMLKVLVNLCAIEMASKDFHYRAKGKPFYGLHELADLVFEIGNAADDINEVYYMGEKQMDPPERAKVAGLAAERVLDFDGAQEDALISELRKLCTETVESVEAAKRTGVSSGTAAVLDEISRKSLQAKGLLGRTMKRNDAIENVVAKGVYIQNDSTPHTDDVPIAPVQTTAPPAPAKTM